LEEFRKVEYHLKAVLVSDSIRQGHTWAYIWVPAESMEDDLIMDLDEKNGCWYKFCEVDVQKVHKVQYYETFTGVVCAEARERR